MKNKQGFLTVTEFSKRKNVSRVTIYKWIEDGKLEGAYKQKGEPLMIPEECLSLEIRLTKPPRVLLSKEEKFERMKRIPFTLAELEQMFEEGKSFREIGDLAGVSWQAIAQLYKKYFSSAMASGRERRKDLVKKKWDQKAISHLDEIDKLSILKEEALKNGYEVSSVQHAGQLGGWFTDRLLINGKLCRVFYSPTASLITSKPGRSKLYYRFTVARATPSKSDFIFFIAGEDPHQIFIFPSEVIAERFKSNKRPLKIFYIPIEYKEPHNNILPKIDWWAYLGAWNLLEK